MLWCSPSKNSPQPMSGPHTPFEPGLLAQLADGGLDERLTVLHLAAGHAPAAPGRRLGRAGRGAAGRGRPPRRRRATTGRHDSERCTTMARATSPNDSKKFFVWRSPGRARLSTPKHPCSRHQSTSASIIASPMPSSRAPGLGVEVGDHAEAAAVGQHARCGRRRSPSRRRRRCRPARGGAGSASCGAELGLEGRAAGRVAGPHLAAASLAAARRPRPPASSASRGRSSLGGRAAALLRRPPPSAALELGDLRQDRLAAAVGRLVQLHALELDRREARRGGSPPATRRARRSRGWPRLAALTAWATPSTAFGGDLGGGGAGRPGGGRWARAVRGRRLGGDRRDRSRRGSRATPAVWSCSFAVAVGGARSAPCRPRTCPSPGPMATWLLPLAISSGRSDVPSKSRPIGAYTNRSKACSTACSIGVFSSGVAHASTLVVWRH